MRLHVAGGRTVRRGIRTVLSGLTVQEASVPSSSDSPGHSLNRAGSGRSVRLSVLFRAAFEYSERQGVLWVPDCRICIVRRNLRLLSVYDPSRLT